ncbi:MAG: hypothetical protein EZS28_041994 [Streblomastix strix]|uniref:Uncharacterized protein n=1 Tax=Streblomastix strix TaxID=222440 RepID=A0A5J4TWM9_9EUKA|nr:MAG: hypothetical protein EZS28_041994 [Streblomastix strix]
MRIRQTQTFLLEQDIENKAIIRHNIDEVTLIRQGIIVNEAALIGEDVGAQNSSSLTILGVNKTKKSSPSMEEVVHNPEGNEYSSARDVRFSSIPIQQSVAPTSIDRKQIDEEFAQITQEVTRN